MMKRVQQRLMRRSLGLLGLTALLASWSGWVENPLAIAQSLPECQPPRSNEYLLLVPNQQADIQTRLQQLLPANAVLTPCRYLNSSVIRVEGFASTEIAAAWAQYLIDTASVQAFVARPPVPASSIAAVPTPNAGGTSTPVPTPAGPTYRPQPLGAGYAVLVNYFNKPELAANVRRLTNQEVGLVAFEQQPYLLAAFTTDPAIASTVLKTLSESGLTAAIVDSRRAMLLTSTVQLN